VAEHTAYTLEKVTNRKKMVVTLRAVLLSEQKNDATERKELFVNHIIFHCLIVKEK
jgi:hypothetical protein